MASQPPDASPDSSPTTPSGDVERVDPTVQPGRESVEEPAGAPGPDAPADDDAGLPGATADD